jgi:hypothetical protein
MMIDQRLTNASFWTNIKFHRFCLFGDRTITCFRQWVISEMLVIQILTVGVVACAIFDLWQRVFQKMTAIPPSNWAMVGRWSLGLMTSGQLIARDLESQAERKNELAVGWLVHYSVAIGYAAVYAWLMHATILQAGLIDGLIFGVISVVVPWFFFLPCLGKGMLARLTPNPPLVCALALMMHSLFGASIGLGFAVFAD